MSAWSRVFAVAPVPIFPDALGRVKTALRCATALRGLDPPGAPPSSRNCRSDAYFCRQLKRLRSGDATERLACHLARCILRFASELIVGADRRTPIHIA